MPSNRFYELQEIAKNARVTFLQNGFRPTRTEGIENIARVLMGFALTEALPHQTVTDASTDDFWNRNMGFLVDSLPGFMRTMSSEKLKELVTRNDGGMALDKEFRDHIAKMDRLPAMPDDRFYPTAIDRIKQLKENMKAGKYQTIEQKRTCLAEYIAARELVNAGRGTTFYYNSKLYKPLDSSVAERAAKLEKEFRNLSDEDINRFFTMGMNRGGGGAMHDALNEVLRSPVEKELERLRIEAMALNADTEEALRNVASRIVLSRHENDAREDQRTFLTSEEYQDEVDEVLESAAFTRLAKNNNADDLLLLARNSDIQPLLKEYNQASSEIDASPFSAMYDSFATNPDKFAKYQQNVTAIFQDEAYQNKKGLSATEEILRSTLRSAYREMLDPNKETFVRTMEHIQAHVANLYINACRKGEREAFEEWKKSVPGLSNLLSDIPLPEPGTAGAYAMELHSVAFAEGAEGTGKLEIFGRLCELYKKVGDEPGWENQPITAEDIKTFEANNLKNANDAVERFGNREYFGNMTDEKSYHLIAQGGSGKAAYEHYQKWVRENEEELEKRANQTGRERLEELLAFPSRKEFLTKNQVENEMVFDVFFDIVAARALERDAAKNPEKYPTGESVDRAYKAFRKSCAGAADGDFSYNDLARAIYKDKTGKAVEDLFREKLITGSLNTSQMVNLPEEDMPSLKSQIEAIKKSAANGSLKTRVSKTHALAQIIAGRQVMKIKPGGDKKLDNRMTKQAFEQAGRIYNVLNRMTEKDFNKLYSKINSGHGGEVVKAFSKVNTYRKFIENLSPETDPQIGDDAAKNIADIMAATMQGSNDKKGLDAPADLQTVWKMSEKLRESPAFTEMMKDPDVIALAMGGKGEELIVKFAEASKKLNDAGKNVQPEHQVNQPEVTNPKNITTTAQVLI